MKRQYWARFLITSAIGTSLLFSCQSTSSLEIIRDLEALNGEERITAYAERIESDPMPELRYNLAYHQMEKKDYDGAIETSLSALEENPDFLRMRFLLLISYRENGDREEYGRTLEEIAREIPRDSEIIELLLDHYHETRDYDGMTAAARQLLKLDPENSKAMSALSMESDYMKSLSGFFELDKVMEDLPEIDTSSLFREDEIMEAIRERYVLPFLF